MAEITLGLGTSHGSQVNLPAELWLAHGDLDRSRTTFDELLVQHGDALVDELHETSLQNKYARVQGGVNALRTALADARADVVVVIGDDQRELFRDDGMPSLAVFWGDEIVEFPSDEEELAPTHRAAMWAMHGESPEAYPVCASLGEWIIKCGVTDGFDLCQFTQQRPDRSLGHAYTFVRRRLMGEEPTPMVPVFVNTYYPPNQPSVKRCIAFGRTLASAIISWPCDARVVVIASGGLSHFVLDEALDRLVLEALGSGDVERLISVPMGTFSSGTSEILNWIVAGAALREAGLEMKLVDYIPGHRSLAGTGCGMAFAQWVQI